MTTTRLKTSEEQPLSEILNAFLVYKTISTWDLISRLGTYTSGITLEPLSASDQETLSKSLEILSKKEKLSSREAILLAACGAPGESANKTKKRIELLQYAANQGEAAAFTLLALESYDHNILFLKEATIGHDELLKSIDEGSVSTKNTNDAAAKNCHLYLTQAIQLGDFKAYAHLASLYVSGAGVKIDLFKAKEYALLGIASGDDVAKKGLKFIYSLTAGASYLASLSLKGTPTKLAKICRRCLDINHDLPLAMRHLQILRTNANGFLSKLNPFQSDRFIIDFNYALATKNPKQLQKLLKENPELFKVLSQEEFRERPQEVRSVETARRDAENYSLIQKRLKITESKIEAKDTKQNTKTRKQVTAKSSELLVPLLQQTEEIDTEEERKYLPKSPR